MLAWPNRHNGARASFGIQNQLRPLSEREPALVSDDGERLNIRKATLREWRSRFAEQLRHHGISANATERAARGQSRTHLKTGIYRSAGRGQSRYLRDHWRRIQREMRAGGLQPNPGKEK
jgi:hypothetical protein